LKIPLQLIKITRAK